MYKWHVQALAAVMLLVSLRAGPPEDSEQPRQGAALVIDTPPAGAAVLRPWQSVCGRILRHRRDPPLYLVTSLWGSQAERVEAREVPTRPAARLAPRPVRGPRRTAPLPPFARCTREPALAAPLTPVRWRRRRALCSTARSTKTTASLSIA